MESTTNARTAATARRLFDGWQETGAKWAKMGMTLRGLQASQCAATLEEVTAHVALCEDLAARYRVTMDPAALWGEDLQARALSKARSANGRRGVKALEAKYGHGFAADLVYEKSGRKIR